MEKRTAFSRALGFLSFKPAARWLALSASVASGLLTVGLLLLLGLLVDWAVSQGKVPTIFDLSAAERERFQQQWQERPPLERLRLLQAIGLEESAAQQRATDLPVPAASEALVKPWQAFVYQVLTERAGSEAAQHYRATLAAEPASLGLLSLVVRSREQWYGSLIGWLAARQPWTWHPGDTTPAGIPYLVGLASLAIVAALLRALSSFAGQACAAKATVEAAARMRRAVYHHTYRLGTLAIRSLGPSEAVSIFTRHIEAIADALFAWLTVTVAVPLTVLFLVILALLVHFWMTVVVLVTAGVVWLVIGQWTIAYQWREDQANRRLADQLALLQESLMLMRLVKVYLMEIVNQTRVEHQLASHARWQQRRLWLQAAYRTALGLLVVWAGVLLLFVAGLGVLDGQLSVPAGFVLAATLASTIGPVRAWLAHWKVLQRGRESAITLFKFLDRAGEVGQVVGAEVLPTLSKRLEFDNVTVREPGTNRVLLQEVSFAIPAGACVALVGPDDLEKHALVYLIPRFLDPTSGEIRIDDHNLRWVALDSLRKQIALVLQHNLVFNDTVSNNIRCGDASLKQPQILEAAKLAHAHQFIQKLPRGYDTPIGDMGHSLTVGEQFRIALARAIVRNPTLLIIEEPPVFHLDEDTQNLLDDTFNRILPGRTVIFLPHRRQTLQRCNRVFLIHKGRLEAHGDHDTLLGKSELYRHLHYLEFHPFVGRE